MFRRSAAAAVGTVVATAVLLSAPPFAHAQCPFNTPGRAKAFKAEMVRAYAPCAAGITFPATNTATAGGTPACTPVVPTSEYSFGDRGRCSLSFRSKLEMPCSDGKLDECNNLHFKVKCSDVRNLLKVPVYGEDAEGWVLRVMWRATVADPGSPGGVTLFEMPTTYAFPTAVKGQLTLATKMTKMNGALLIGMETALPACSNLEVVGVSVIDPTGARFATVGSSSG